MRVLIRPVLGMLVVVVAVNGSLPVCSDQQFLFRGVCLSLVGGSCSFPTTVEQLNNATWIARNVSKENFTTDEQFKNYQFMMECTPGAFCTRNGRFPVCTCLPNLAESRDRKCVAGFGQSCGDVQCEDVDAMKCSGNENEGGTCECKKSLHEYSEVFKRCVGLVGAFCNSDSWFEPQCTMGASCMFRRGEKYGNGECQCQGPFYVETDHRTCQRLNVTYISSTKHDPESSASAIMLFVGIIVGIFLLFGGAIVCCGLLACVCSLYDYWKSKR